MSKPHPVPSGRPSQTQTASTNTRTGLTIAGFDPSSGAGVTADLKVFAAFGVYGVAAITALTVQSTLGVRRVDPVSPEVLAQTLDCLAEDMEISGIKIGMLATEAAVGVVGSFLARSGIPADRIVLDPVLVSSSGHELLSLAGIDRMMVDLLPLVGWITPNINELAKLSEASVSDRISVEKQGDRLAARYPAMNIVVTGGHLDRPDDFFRSADGKTEWFLGRRVETAATHGTGCAFSSALLARLMCGEQPSDAVSAAKAYVRKAMEAAKPIGRGRGPLHHLYPLD